MGRLETIDEYYFFLISLLETVDGYFFEMFFSMR